MKFVAGALALLCFVSLSQQQQFFNRTCASYGVDPITPFFKSRYSRSWHVYQLYDYDKTLEQDCIVWNYLEITSEHSKVIETMVNLATQKPKILDSKMHFDREFIGQYTYDLVLDNIVPEYIKILGTDYRNFAVEWSCVDLGPNQCKTYVYVLTEKPIPDKWVVDRCNRILEKHNIDLRPARFVIQDDRCFATKDN